MTYIEPKDESGKRDLFKKPEIPVSNAIGSSDIVFPDCVRDGYNNLTSIAELAK